jgi:hypothetical protein
VVFDVIEERDKSGKNIFGVIRVGFDNFSDKDNGLKRSEAAFLFKLEE